MGKGTITSLKKNPHYGMSIIHPSDLLKGEWSQIVKTIREVWKKENRRSIIEEVLDRKKNIFYYCGKCKMNPSNSPVLWNEWIVFKGKENGKVYTLLVPLNHPSTSSLEEDLKNNEYLYNIDLSEAKVKIFKNYKFIDLRDVIFMNAYWMPEYIIVDGKKELPIPKYKSMPENELEQYLLNKRLELKKYFVFNLGKEVRDSKKCKDKEPNLYPVNERLKDDINKLTFSCQNYLEKEGWNFVKLSPEKEFIRFLDKDSEFTENDLIEKMTNGEDCYIVFEKHKLEIFFEWGKKSLEKMPKLYRTNDLKIMLRDKNIKVCKGKKEVLEIIKEDTLFLLN